MDAVDGVRTVIAVYVVMPARTCVDVGQTTFYLRMHDLCARRTNRRASLTFSGMSRR